jgi:hypothetical protein
VVRLLRRCLLRLLDVQGHGVDEIDLIIQPGEPASVDSRAPADVQDNRGWGWDVAQDQFLGPREFELAQPLGQTLGLAAGFVVLQRLVRQPWRCTACL